MTEGRISGYFDAKYMTVLRLEQILHNFENQNFSFFFFEQVKDGSWNRGKSAHISWGKNTKIP